MQYLMIFLAVLAVVAVLFLFIFTAIRQTALRIREQVRGRYLDELSMFDRIYKEKMDRLKEIREEQELLNSNIMKKGGNAAKAKESDGETGKAVYASVSSGGDIPVSRLSSPDFFEEYRYVKNAFQQDRDEIVRGVSGDEPDIMWQLGEIAEKILKLLPEETAFSMSTLEPEEQLGILDEFFDESSKELLNWYQEHEKKEEVPFEILTFWSYVKNLADLYNGEITVYTGDHDYKAALPGVKTVYDDTICEGIRVRRGSRIYDYSL